MATNGIPGNISGSAPLYLGSFASQRGAMAQKMTDRAIQLAEKEQTRQAKERADMLKYFSFDTVKGLGREVQDMKLKSINGMIDEFSKRWIENGRKLTDKDYIDLQRRKNDLEQEFSDMRKNVTDYWKIINEHTTGKNRITANSFEKLRKWVDEGRIGEDPYKYVEYLPDTFASIGKNAGYFRTLKPQRNTEIVDGKKITTYIPYPENDAVQGYLNALSGNPEHEALMQNPEVRDEYLQNIKNVARAYTMVPKPTVEPATESEIKANQMKQMPPKVREMASDMGWGELKENEIKDLSETHEKVLRIGKKDPEMLKSLVGMYAKGLGRVADYQIETNGDITLFGEAEKNKAPKSLTLPAFVEGDNAQNITSMEQILNILPGWTTTKLNRFSGYLNPDYPVKVDNPEPPTAVTNLQQYLDVPDNKVGVENASGKKILASAQREDIKTLINTLLPDAKVVVKDPLFGGVMGKRPIEVDGEYYNMANLSDRQKLMDKATNAAGIGRIPLQEGSAKQKQPPAPDETEDVTVKIGSEDSIAGRHNNPGNLMYNNQPGAEKGEKKEGGGYWAKFETPEAGYEALISDIDAKKEGKTSTGLDGESTLAEFISVYAPKKDNNDTESYIKNVSKELGVDSKIKLKEIDSKELAKVIAKRESSTKIEEKQSVPVITGPEDYAKLKSGERYIFNGQEAIKE